MLWKRNRSFKGKEGGDNSREEEREGKWDVDGSGESECNREEE